MLRATLDGLAGIRAPGGRVDLPFTWHEAARTVRRQKNHEPPPVTKLCTRKPWLFLRLASGDIPEGCG